MNGTQKVIVLLSEAEHAKLKVLAKSNRRTLGRQLAALAFKAEGNRDAEGAPPAPSANSKNEEVAA